MQKYRYLFCILKPVLLFYVLFSSYLYSEDTINVDDIGDEDIQELDDAEDFDDTTDTTNDPYEKINRKIFYFNEEIDKVANKIFTPGTKPGVIRVAFSNFAQNFFEIPRFINCILQGDGKNACTVAGRYIINTCIGFFGIADVAEKLGLNKKRTTFDDALKKWGVPSGSFVVLPFLGPTCMRGAVSQMVHIPLDTVALVPIKDVNNVAKRGIYITSWVFDALNTRSAYADFLKNVTSISKDKYKTVRNLVMAVENQ